MRYTKSIITLFIFIFCINLVVGQQNNIAISTTVAYDNGQISIQNTKLIESLNYTAPLNSTGNYSLKLYDHKNQILYTAQFDFDLTILSVPPKEWFDKDGNQIYIPNKTQNQSITIDKLTTVVFTPYFTTIKQIKIYDSKNNELASKDLENYSVCNQNKICDNKETKDICPEDCTIIQKQTEISIWQRIWNFIKAFFS